ncbi:MAG: nucleotidyltransferase domain-containing protein [Ruminiclostridium sp.]|nr:nucleotidyltransferase domain-containing protein [Ruminiclostridium sp.]
MDINEIIKKYSIKLLLTFGSYNTDRFTEHSDIDVAFLSVRTLTTDEELQLLSDLFTYFRRDGIDLVNLAKAVPLLTYEIACNSHVLYEENNFYIKFKMKASARYADTKFLREARKNYIREQIDMIGAYR